MLASAACLSVWLGATESLGWGSRTWFVKIQASETSTRLVRAAARDANKNKD
jgi:hypothetical protein